MSSIYSKTGIQDSDVQHLKKLKGSAVSYLVDGFDVAAMPSVQIALQSCDDISNKWEIC